MRGRQLSRKEYNRIVFTHRKAMDEPADESNHAMLLRQETPRDSDQTIRSLCGNYLEWRIYRHPTCQDDPGGTHNQAGRSAKGLG